MKQQGPVTQASQELEKTVREARKTHKNETFVQLAEQNQLSPEEQEQLCREVQAEIDDLKEASTLLRETYQMAAAEADELETRLKEGRESGRKRRIFHHAPANSVIDLEEQKSGYFALGVNLYKMILLVVLGSFAGVVVELIWCLLRHGHLESRSGLVYGPFNLLYGVGALTLTLCLYRFRNRSSWFSFIGGMIVGSVVEYACSWGQEMLFGSVSWDYSNMPFNLNGRICLLYSVFWGFLGVLWMKNLYPRVAALILKLPNRGGKILTVALAIFMTFNGIMSLLAVDRWSERRAGEPAVSAVDTFFDEHFPNERMERVYANMDFGD